MVVCNQQAIVLERLQLRNFLPWRR
jgi:hypothetical protein